MNNYSNPFNNMLNKITNINYSINNRTNNINNNYNNNNINDQELIYLEHIKKIYNLIKNELSYDSSISLNLNQTKKQIKIKFDVRSKNNIIDTCIIKIYKQFPNEKPIAKFKNIQHQYLNAKTLLFNYHLIPNAKLNTINNLILSIRNYFANEIITEKNINTTINNELLLDINIDKLLNDISTTELNNLNKNEEYIVNLISTTKEYNQIKENLSKLKNDNINLSNKIFEMYTYINEKNNAIGKKREFLNEIITNLNLNCENYELLKNRFSKLSVINYLNSQIDNLKEQEENIKSNNNISNSNELKTMLNNYYNIRKENNRNEIIKKNLENI